MEKVDVLVIGGGPSGSVAAAIVNKAGYKVKLVEKLKFPRFVIGESLLPRCMEALEAAGFLESLKKFGFQEKFGAKFVEHGTVCDFNFSDQFSKGWNWTWQVPRADFDQILTDDLMKSGVEVLFETTVKDILFDGTNSITTVEQENGSSSKIHARFIIDASGYGRVIPKLFNLDRPSDLPARKTLFTHIRDTRRMDYDEPNRITIVSHKEGVWIWVIPFSNGNTSVGFVGLPSFFEQFEGSPEQMFRALIQSEPHIKDRFDQSEYIFEPRTIEGWSVTTDQFYGDGFVLTGNVTEFLDPIFSSGVTLATVSGHKAALLVCRQLNGENINWETEFQQPTMAGVNTFRSYVTAWYDGTLPRIFFAPNQNPTIKNYICSVLAGDVWDLDNPYVKKHESALKALAKVIQIEASV